MKEINIFGRSFFAKEEISSVRAWAEEARKHIISDNIQTEAYKGYSYNIIETIFDGEKTEGELGAPLSYMPDYTALSYRSWQAYTESDLAQIIVKAHVNWVIGHGLKLQAEPVADIIDSEGFNFDRPKFVRSCESRFRLYAKTRKSVYNGMFNYNQSQRVAVMNAIVGGDILCIDMLVDGLPSKRLIDGIWVQTPGPDEISKAKERGNEIVHGVELDEKNTHVAYYVINRDREYTRIEARGKNTGRLQAYLLYGSEYRIDSVRGMPMLSAVLEKIKKLDRYNEAIVGGAEESAKIPWVWEHNQFSDGTNPDIAKTLQSITGEASPENSLLIDMTKQTSIIKRTFEKEPVNAPVGTTLKKIPGGMEVNQEVFTTGNFIFMCAAVEVPYEVALMKYVNSFSSSRMASQSWLKILQIKRAQFNDNYNRPFYSLFLDSQILGGKIQADGYLSAMNSGDVILLEAYRNCRFTGPGVPQADPSKEVKAEIAKIDAKLTSRDEAIERLDGGDDFETVLDKLASEQEMIDERMPEPEIEPDPGNTEKNLDTLK